MNKQNYKRQKPFQTVEFDIDEFEFEIIDYQQRSDRPIIKTVYTQGRYLSKRDYVLFICKKCNKKVRLGAQHFAGHDNEGDKRCRACRQGYQIDLPIEFIKELYYNQNKSTLEIAEILETTKKNILSRMRDFGLERRTCSGAAKLRFEKWPESNPSYREDVKEKLSEANIQRYKNNPEQKAKQKGYLTKWRKSPEIVEKWKKSITESKANMTPEAKVLMMARQYDTRRKNGTLNCSSFEKKFEDMLIESGQEHIKEFTIRKGNRRYRYDFSLEENILVEINGSGTHGDLRRFSHKDIVKTGGIPGWVPKPAHELWDKDIAKKEYAESHGYTVRYLWQEELKNIDKIDFFYNLYTKKELLNVPQSYLEMVVPYVVSFVRFFFPEFIVEYKEKSLKAELKGVRGSKARKNFWSHPHTSLIAGNKFLKNRFMSYWLGAKSHKLSIADAFYDDQILEKIIRYRVGLNKKRETFDISMKNILRGFISGNYAISWFSPSLAYEIYKRFAPDAKTFYDPCAGFGARMLGFKAFGGERYVGVDYNPATVAENNALLEEISLDGFVVEGQAELYEPTEHFDLAFTCPPYFNSEKYSQDMLPYQDVGTEFLYPMIENMMFCADKVLLIVDGALKDIISEQYAIVNEISLTNKRSHFGNYKNSEYVIVLK